MKTDYKISVPFMNASCDTDAHRAQFLDMIRRIGARRVFLIEEPLAAGLGAGLFFLSGSKEWEPLVSTALPAAGFNGISVALLASSNPIGCIFSALFISHITVGGGFMDASVFPGEVADIISGVVIYLCAFSLLFKGSIMKLMNGKPEKKIRAKTGKEGEK